MWYDVVARRVHHEQLGERDERAEQRERRSTVPHVAEIASVGADAGGRAPATTEQQRQDARPDTRASPARGRRRSSAAGAR